MYKSCLIGALQALLSTFLLFAPATQAATLVTPYAVTYAGEFSINAPRSVFSTVPFDPALGAVTSVKMTAAIDFTFTADYTYTGGINNTSPPGVQVFVPPEHISSYDFSIFGTASVGVPGGAKGIGTLAGRSGSLLRNSPTLSMSPTNTPLDFEVTKSLTSSVTVDFGTSVSQDLGLSPNNDTFPANLSAGLTANYYTDDALDGVVEQPAVCTPETVIFATGFVCTTRDIRYVRVTNSQLAARIYGDVTIEYTPTVVPIPAAAWLFSSGLIGLIGIARRKKS